MEIAKEVLPSGELKWIRLLKQWGRHETDRLGPTRKFVAEAVNDSGAVLKIRDWGYTTVGEMCSWADHIHDSGAFGLPGRLLVCITALVPLVSYVTALPT